MASSRDTRFWGLGGSPPIQLLINAKVQPGTGLIGEYYKAGLSYTVVIYQNPMSAYQLQDSNRLMGEDKNPQQAQESTYREEPYRYVNLTAYILAALVNSLPAQTFSSINTLVEQKFKYNQVMITLFTLVFAILHPIGAVPANWILDRFGMKIGCITGGLLVIVGVWMRTLIEQGQPAFCLVGSILAAIGNVFILNSPSILANNWFKPQSIPSVISFSVLANIVSITLGNAIPGFVLKDQDSEQQKNAQQAIQSFLRVQAIIISALLLLLFILLRDKPTVPPSKSAQNQLNKKQNYSETLKKLFKKTEYLKIMFIMTFSYGTIMSYLANLNQALKNLNYSNQDSVGATSSVVLAAMLAGIVGSFFFVNKIKRTLQYRAIIVVCILLKFVMFALLQVVLWSYQKSGWQLYIAGATTGFFAIPITSILMAYSSEVVYPLGQGSATGYLFAASQTFGSVFGIGSAAIIDSIDKQTNNLTKSGSTPWQIYLFMGLHTFFIFVAFLAALRVKNVLNRTKFEQGGKGNSETEEGLIFSVV